MRRTDEGSRRKCGQYWPKEDGDQEVYGHIAVVNHRVDKHAHYNQTTLELHNTEVPHIPVFVLMFSISKPVIMMSYMIYIMISISPLNVAVALLSNITRKLYFNI